MDCVITIQYDNADTQHSKWSFLHLFAVTTIIFYYDVFSQNIFLTLNKADLTRVSAHVSAS